MPVSASPPLLTVLMTVHNAMPYVEEAVHSILAQTLTNFVFLIVDSASDDGSREFLMRIHEQYTRREKTKDGKGTPPNCAISLLLLPENEGRCASLVKGLAQVATEYTALMAADDCADPDRLRKQLAYFLAHPTLDLLGSGVRYIDSSGNMIGHSRFPTKHTHLRARFTIENQFPRSACMFRTEAARRAGGFSSAFRLAPAAALWASMIRQGSITASINEPLAIVRLRPSRTRRDLALLMLRAKESYRLTTLLRATPGLSLAARQAVLCMGAHALSRLGRRSNALALYAKSVYMAPWLFPVNPLIWRRIIARLRRRRTGYFL